MCYPILFQYNIVSTSHTPQTNSTPTHKITPLQITSNNNTMPPKPKVASRPVATKCSIQTRLRERVYVGEIMSRPHKGCESWDREASTCQNQFGGSRQISRSLQPEGVRARWTSNTIVTGYVSLVEYSVHDKLILIGCLHSSLPQSKFAYGHSHSSLQPKFGQQCVLVNCEQHHDRNCQVS